jgi:predicted adenylyl cyclase CyaB
MSGAKRLVEFKARYEDLGKARALLSGSEHVGTFDQVDAYFSLGERRLKVRTVKGRLDAQLVYYERPDEGGVKSSRVLLAPLPDGQAVLDILRRALPVLAEVRKTREVYRHQGVQVHLDTVAGLGRFIEFERVLDDATTEAAARATLEALRAYFQIPEEDAMASSYSDLVEGRR